MSRPIIEQAGSYLPKILLYVITSNFFLFINDDLLLYRFDGVYTLIMTNVSDHDSCGYIDGMKDFQIEFIIQAVEIEHRKGIELKTIETQATICSAFVLRQPYRSKDTQRLPIAFDKDGTKIIKKHVQLSGANNSEVRVSVHFHLKSSYFDILEQSVGKVPAPVVHRIMADELIFSTKHLFGLELSLDKSQMVALHTILFHPQKYFPKLISGPFGTGKTHVLAVATLLILLNHISPKVLVCTQQRESAENFLIALLRVALSCRMGNVSIYLLIEYGRQNPDLKPYYIHAKDLNVKLRGLDLQSTKLLIVSTCITSRKVSSSKIDFTHIMIDEGGLMREPEAVIPLHMANADTTIVIAGDPQQV